MRKIMTMLGWKAAGRVEKIEYRYVFLAPEPGAGIVSVCVG